MVRPLPQHLLPTKTTSAAITETGLCATEEDHEQEDRSRPDIVVINSHKDYVDFLEADDRLCVVKFYASWCKSCARFGKRYRHLAFEEGDHINIDGTTIHTGKVRFAEVEYTASAKLCKSLKVRKLPTIHMYRRGKGKIADMVCKPSQFHLVVDEMNRLLEDESAVGLSVKASTKQPTGIELETESEVQLNKIRGHGVDANGNVTSTSFESLADEIMTSLKEKNKEEEKDKEGSVKKEKWFPFPF